MVYIKPHFFLFYNYTIFLYFVQWHITEIGTRRFALPDEQNPKGFEGRAKCGGGRRGRERSDRPSRPEPEPRSGEACTVCYAKLLPPNIIQHLKEKLAGAQWLVREDEEGKKRKIPGAVVGNRIYAWRRENRICEEIDRIGFERGKTLFITLTVEYGETDWRRKKSWLRAQEELPKYLRKLKQAGMKDCLACKEANGGGGCHVHLLCKWNKKLKMFLLNGEWRLANGKLRKLIKSAWQWNVDVKGMGDEDVKGYMKKYLGKTGHIEDALRRAERNWENEGDEEHRETDCKKIWTFYYCDILKIRQFTVTRASPEQKEKQKAARAEKAAQAAALIKEMNNQTEQKKLKDVKQWRLPKWITTRLEFAPYTGEIEKGSADGRLIDDFTEWVDKVNNGQWGTKADFENWRKNK
jgi:hypothetical protein